MENLQTQVLSRARPIRLAFLVELEEASHPKLDAIFQYAFSIWAGRFSLIVPCVSGEPIPEYLPWLAAFDPDLIYSYVDLSLKKQTEFHETYFPSALQHHMVGREDMPISWDPSPSISPLEVQTLLPLVGLPGPFDRTRGLHIVGAMERMEHDRFLADSFGFARPNLRNLMRTALSDSGKLLLVISEEDCQPRQRFIQDPEATVPDTTSLLERMAETKRVLGVAQLSAMFTPRINLESRRWANSFNITVGDTVEDRLLYWNARGLMSPWRDGTDVDFCIPRAKFDEPAFVEALRNYLNRRNFVNGSGGNGPNRATLRSLSLADAEMRGLVDQIQRGQTWIAYNHEQVASLREVVPEPASLQHRFFVDGQHGLRSPNAWIESFSIGDELRMTAPQPEHMRYVPPSLANSHAGAWAVDLDIERTVDHSPYSNVSHRWRLPRRLRVTQAFCPTYQLSKPHGEYVWPRVSSGGFLTLFSVANESLPNIHIPRDLNAILTGLQRGKDWPPFNRFIQPQGTPQLCHEARRSDAGRHFWGVYQLFGSMNTARSILLHEFWRTQFERYGATDQRTLVRQEAAGKRLLRRLGNRILNLADPAHVNTLSEIVLRESDDIRATTTSIPWTKFENDFSKLVKRFDAENPIPPEAEQNREEIDRHTIGSLRDSVKNLCNLRILYQGYEHKCRKCFHRSWISIADLRPEIACEVCRDIQQAPVDEPWRFRLNGFLHEALQRHGIGPLFWVLSRFQRCSSSSFWFEGPLNIFPDQASADENRPETDIDLTIVNNGIVIMCEVKQSERGFTNPKRLADTMLKLRPDVAMIAVMEANGLALQKKFLEFSDYLEGTGIKPELLTLDAKNDISGDPYF